MFGKKRAPKVYPVKMVVGLGNPGAGYKGTRHNVGFDVVDDLATVAKAKISTSKSQSLIAEVELFGVPVVLVKPLTFMNRSGQAVSVLARSYNIKPEDILVIADDMDLPTGKVRMRPKGGSGGHNGHKSVIASLQSEDYPRLRIGIGKAGETVDHVLSRFRPEEKPDIDAARKLCVLAVEKWLTDGIDRAMELANRGSE